MLNIKTKENSIYEEILGPQFNSPEIRKKIEELIIQRKEMMLNLIKNIVKFYGNISQIYNNEPNKKNILKSLLNKYDIKEKIKIDLNYISHIHKENNFEDKIITEVDEDKENDEDEDEIKQKNSNINNLINTKPNQTTKENITLENKNIHEYKKILNDNLEKGIESNKNKNENKDISVNNNNINYDDNLNNLIKKILIDQFPEKYKTNLKFKYIERNKYSFGNKTFLVFIQNDDIVLKEEIENNIINEKLTLKEFYNKYCGEEKKEKKSNFIYTKKIRQKYIKIKNEKKENNEKNDKEQSMEKKSKNENSTTISDNDKIQQSILSKLNEMGEMKISMSEEKETEN